MKIQVNTHEKEANGYALHTGGDANSGYDAHQEMDGAVAYDSALVVFESREEAEAHADDREISPCYWTPSPDGFAVWW